MLFYVANIPLVVRKNILSDWFLTKRTVKYKFYIFLSLFSVHYIDTL